MCPPICLPEILTRTNAATTASGTFTANPKRERLRKLSFPRDLCWHSGRRPRIPQNVRPSRKRCRPWSPERCSPLSLQTPRMLCCNVNLRRSVVLCCPASVETCCPENCRPWHVPKCPIPSQDLSRLLQINRHLLSDVIPRALKWPRPTCVFRLRLFSR